MSACDGRGKKLWAVADFIGLVHDKRPTDAGGYEPLIDIAIWQQVSKALHTAKAGRARQRTYDHYLKGFLWRGACAIKGARDADDPEGEGADE